MKKEKLESLLIDYIDDNLNAEDKAVVEKELQSNPEAQRLYQELKEVMSVMENVSGFEPSARLQSAFDNMLANESKQNYRAKTIFFSPSIYRVAAAVTLLVLGCGAGYFISKYNQQQRDLAEVKAQMAAIKNEMLAKLDNDQSASQRLLGVTVALNIEKVDHEILNALAKAMNEDPNTNVRVAALEALSKFHREPGVKRILIASLSTQKDPLVQITLIRILVEMKEKSSLQELEKITNDDEILKEVKDEAHAGILRLS